MKLCCQFLSYSRTTKQLFNKKHKTLQITIFLNAEELILLLNTAFELKKPPYKNIFKLCTRRRLVRIRNIRCTHTLIVVHTSSSEKYHTTYFHSYKTIFFNSFMQFQLNCVPDFIFYS